jgi:hypothetical protein
MLRFGSMIIKHSAICTHCEIINWYEKSLSTRKKGSRNISLLINGHKRRTLNLWQQCITVLMSWFSSFFKRFTLSVVDCLVCCRSIKCNIRLVLKYITRIHSNQWRSIFSEDIFKSALILFLCIEHFLVLLFFQYVDITLCESSCICSRGTLINRILGEGIS